MFLQDSVEVVEVAERVDRVAGKVNNRHNEAQGSAMYFYRKVWMRLAPVVPKNPSLDSEVSIEVRPRCFPDDLQDEIEVLGAEGVEMPGGGDTDVAQDEEVHEDGEIVNGEVSGSHCVISF